MLSNDQLQKKTRIHKLQQALETAHLALAILEQQAAGYTSLTIPTHLKIELDDKRQEIIALEAKLRELEAEISVIKPYPPKSPDPKLTSKPKTPKLIAIIITIVGITVAIIWVISGPGIFPPPTSETPVSLEEQLESLAATQAIISTNLTGTAQAQPAESPVLDVFTMATSTALQIRIQQIEVTQTAYVEKLKQGLLGKVILPAQSVYVRKTPCFPSNDSNAAGSLKPGDEVIVIGWTVKNAQLWYKINVPEKNYQGVWISGKIKINDKIEDSLEIFGYPYPPQELRIPDNFDC